MGNSRDLHTQGQRFHRASFLDKHFVFDTESLRFGELRRGGEESMERVGRAWADVAWTPSTGRAERAPAPADGAEPIRSMILQVSGRCDLRCIYCSAEFGAYGHGYRSMDLETAVSAVDFLFEKSRSNRLALTYFGGEPLLNMPVMVESARYARTRAEREGRTISLHVVTNGVGLNADALQTLAELGFTFTVSLDGEPGYHDVTRPSVGGESSYAATEKALRTAAERGLRNRITIRGTYLRQSAYFFPHLRFLVEQGFTRNLSYEPAFLPPDNPLSLRIADMTDIERAYGELARYYVERVRNGTPFCLWDIDESITKLARAERVRSRCGSGESLVAVTSEGEIYGCHMSTGIDKAFLGTIHGGFARERRGEWERVHANGRPGCSGCWLESLCGGGCTTHAVTFNDDIDEPFGLECRIIDIEYRAALWVASEVPELVDLVRRASRGAPQDVQGHVATPLWALLEDQRLPRRRARIVVADL